MKKWPKLSTHRGWLRAACVFSLASLGLMVWSLVDPRPVPVVVAMSLGQVLGTLSLAAFLVVVVADMRLAHLEREPETPPESQPPRTDCDSAHRLRDAS